MQAAAPPKRKSEEESEAADASKASRAPKLPSGESTTTDTIGFEYLDHTADIQIHGWAPRLETAMEQVAVGMFNYITELEPFNIDEACTQEIEVTGRDMESLLYEFLNEMLMLFCIDKLVCKEVKILEFDREAFRIKAQGKGERWTREKHRHGTEIKAITYSAMQIYEKDGRAEVFVIVDI